MTRNLKALSIRVLVKLYLICYTVIINEYLY